MTEELTSICRVCLSFEGGFYPIKAHGLDFIFEQVTGLRAKADDRLPQLLCERCSSELRSCQQFQLISNQSNDLLHDVLMRYHCITKDLIATVKTENNKQKEIKDESNTQIFLSSNLEDSEIKIEFEQESETENFDDFLDSECVATPIHTYATPTDNNTTPIDKNATPIDQNTTAIDNNTTAIDNNTTAIDNNTTATDKNTTATDNNKSATDNTKNRKRTSRKAESLTKRKRQPVKPKSLKTRLKKQANVKVKNYKVNHEANALIKSCFKINKLTHEEQMALYKKREDTLHYKVAPFKCEKCYSGFISESMLKNHIVQHTDAKGLYECDICKTHFRTKCRVKIHLNYGPHHLRYECRKCNLVTAHRSTATQHADWHNGTTFECQHCDKVFNMKSSYKNHLRVKHASGFVCVLCGHNFFNEKGLSHHKARQHRLDGHLPVEGPMCVPCDIRFVSDDALNAHLSVSLKHVKKNNIWSSSYPTAHPLGRNELRRVRKQIKLADNKIGEDIICEQCGMELKNARAYHAHFRSKHPGNTRTLYPSVSRPLVCELCGRVFQSKAQLSYHMTTHAGEKELKCNQCDETFQTATEFRAHKKKHLNVLCNLCGRQFTDPSNMRRHKKVVHTDARPHTCELCGKTFKTTYLMKIHTDYVHNKKPWPKRKRQRQSTGAREGELDVEFEN